MSVCLREFDGFKSYLCSFYSFCERQLNAALSDDRNANESRRKKETNNGNRWKEQDGQQLPETTGAKEIEQERESEEKEKEAARVRKKVVNRSYIFCEKYEFTYETYTGKSI